jgi:hypothetical protein
MKLNNKAIVERKPTINARLSHFSVLARQPLPVSEGNKRPHPQSFSFNIFF